MSAAESDAEGQVVLDALVGPVLLAEASLVDDDLVGAKKWCFGCKDFLPLSAFNRDRGRKDVSTAR